MENIEYIDFLVNGFSARITGTPVSLLINFGDISCIDPIRNHTFRNSEFEQKCNLVITELLKKKFLKECPYCAELVKAQAKKCMHCKADL